MREYDNDDDNYKILKEDRIESSISSDYESENEYRSSCFKKFRRAYEKKRITHLLENVSLQNKWNECPRIKLQAKFRGKRKTTEGRELHMGSGGGIFYFNMNGTKTYLNDEQKMLKIKYDINRKNNE